jgi:hypothetical protein
MKRTRKTPQKARAKPPPISVTSQLANIEPRTPLLPGRYVSGRWYRRDGDRFYGPGRRHKFGEQS